MGIEVDTSSYDNVIIRSKRRCYVISNICDDTGCPMVYWSLENLAKISSYNAKICILFLYEGTSEYSGYDV